MNSTLETIAAPSSMPVPPVEALPYPPRYWWLKRILIGGGAWLVFLIALRLWWGWEADRRFDAEVARIQAAGEPIFPQDFDSKPVPDDRNAVPFILAAEQHMNVTPDQDALIRKVAADWKRIRRNKDAVRALIEANAKTLAALEQAAERPEVDWQVRIRTPAGDHLLTSVTPARTLCQLSAVAGVYQHQSGDDAAALRTVHASFRHGAILDEHPFMITHVEAIYCQTNAIAVIRQLLPELAIAPRESDGGDSPDTVRGRLQLLMKDLLDETRYQPALYRAMLAVRMDHWDMMDQLRRGSATFSQLTGTPISSTSMWTGVYDTSLALPLCLLDGAATLQKMSSNADSVREASWPRVQARWPSSPDHHSLAAEILGPLRMTPHWMVEYGPRMHFRHLARRRMCAIAIALRLYHVEQGKLASNLNVLIPDYLDSLPVDPFSPNDRSFLFEPEAPHPLLYSVSDNGLDDGGKLGSTWQPIDFPFYLDGYRPELEEANQDAESDETDEEGENEEETEKTKSDADANDQP